jgi:hypothetical protein
MFVITRFLSSPWNVLGLATLLGGLAGVSLAQDYDLAAPGEPPVARSLASGTVTLFQNVRIFNGKSATLSAPSNVLVRDNIIERISSGAINVGDAANIQVIAGGGRVLMPGLIDAHWHAFMAATRSLSS